MNKRVLVIFVDALGPRQWAAAKGSLSFLTDERPLDGVFGYSSGALATVLTGASPRVHGRMCLFAGADRHEAPGPLAPLSWLGLLPKALHERSFIRTRLSRLVARHKGWTGYFALHRVPPKAFGWLEVPEREDLFQAQTIGSATTFLTRARRAGLDVYASPWQLSENERWTQAFDTLARTKPALSFLYATELDGVLHREGNEGASVRQVVSRISGHIQRAHDILSKQGDDVLTLVVGDHGMADVRRVVDPGPAVARAARARCFVDSTMLRVWGSNEDIARLRAATERLRFPGVWLEGSDLERRSVPTMHSYGRAIFVLAEGAIFSPSDVGGSVRGMHGYDLGNSSTRAALACTAPLGPNVRTLADVAPLVCNHLGLS